MKKQHQQQQQPQQQQKEEEKQIEPHQAGNILRSDSKRLFRGGAAPSPLNPLRSFQILTGQVPLFRDYSWGICVHMMLAALQYSRCVLQAPTLP